MPVIWTDPAKARLKEIYSYYKITVSVALAKKIKTKIFAATRYLAVNPLIGQEEELLKFKKQGHRYLVEGNYKIIYLPVKKKVYILDVFDTQQNPVKMTALPDLPK